jgi:uncharacterized membrane protein YdjX (TVP38/TMEM64 family)
VNNQTESNAASAASTWKWVLSILLLALLAGLAVYLKVPAALQVLLKQALDAIARLGVWAPLLFVLFYVACCLFFIPSSLLTLGGGAIFGLVQGSIYVSLGATLGATAAFLLGRYAAREWVSRKMSGRPGFAAIDRAVAADGWRIVLLVRLCPIFPFVLINYAFGLTSVSLRHYVLATWIGIMPASLLLVYFGSLANPDEARAGPLGWAFRFLVAFAAILLAGYVTRLARRALSKELAK